MAETIKLVKGDELPQITLTLTDDVTSSAVNLSAPTTTVTVKFRKKGTTTTLSTISTIKTSGGTDGKVHFNFSGNVLDVDPGEYEGEVVIDYNGLVQTVYDVLKFRVRANS